jgi:hypothetical protein
MIGLWRGLLQSYQLLVAAPDNSSLLFLGWFNRIHFGGGRKDLWEKLLLPIIGHSAWKSQN